MKQRAIKKTEQNLIICITALLCDMLSASTLNRVQTSLVISNSSSYRKAQWYSKLDAIQLCQTWAPQVDPFPCCSLAKSPRPLQQHLHSKVNSSESPSLCSAMSLEMGSQLWLASAWIQNALPQLIWLHSFLNSWIIAIYVNITEEKLSRFL